MVARITIEMDDDDAGTTFADIAKSMNRADDASKKLNESNKKNTSTLEEINKKMKSLQVVQGLQFMRTAALDFFNVLKRISDENNPAMVRLNDTFFRLQNTITKLGEDPAVQRLLDGIGKSIDEDLIPSVSRLARAWHEAQDAATLYIAKAMEAVGLAPKGTVQTTEGDLAKNNAARENDDDERMAIQEQKRRLQLRKINEQMADITKTAGDQEFSAKTKLIEKQEKLNELIGEYTKYVQNLATRETNNAEQQKKNAKDIEKGMLRLNELQQQKNALIQKERDWRQQLRKDADEFEKRAVQIEHDQAVDASEKQKAKMESLKQQFQGGMTGKDFLEKQNDIAGKANEQLLKLKQQQTKSYLTGDVKGFFEAEQQKTQIVAEALKAQKELRDKFGKEGNVLDKIKGQLSGKDVMGQVQKDRLEKARQDMLDKLHGEGKLGQDGKVFGGTSAEREKSQLNLNKQLADARNKAQKQFQKDLRGGKIGQEETDRATNDLTRNVVDTGRKTGQLSSDTAAGLKAALDAQQEAANKIQQHDEEIQETTEKLNDVLEQLRDEGGKGRQRAMRK